MLTYATPSVAPLRHTDPAPGKKRLPGARCLLQCRIIADANLRSTAVITQESNFEAQPQALAGLLAGIGLSFTPEQVEQLDHYRRLLWSWNERMNLTRHTTLVKFVNRDVFDSHQFSLLLERGARVLDVGTGGGVPGVVLAILRPDLSVSLCESTQKKARAVEAIVGELEIPVPVFATRAEEVLQVSTFDTLVARALAPLSKILTWLTPHWDAFDRLLIVKGPAWVEERADARHRGLLHGLELRKAATYETPGTGAESILLSIQRSTG
ncbi:MAG: 16S rRNA (guanine(527)-N(7))-methyltransferase RsmG [Planctomycetes bacterium]|nr:16S rRNA (guanine(527)-N(7))-methyltransferase RsmG [Planctomycetota bacterium]